MGLRASLPQPSHLPRVLSSGLSRATPGAGCARCYRTRGGNLGLLRGHGRLVGEGPSVGSRGRAWSPCLAKALACRLRPASLLLPRPRRRTWPGKSRLGNAQTQASCTPTQPWLLSWMYPCMRQTPLAVPLSLTNGTQTCPPGVTCPGSGDSVAAGPPGCWQDCGAARPGVSTGGFCLSASAGNSPGRPAAPGGGRDSLPALAS